MKVENMEMHIEAFRCYKPQPGDVLIVKPAASASFRLGPESIRWLKEQLESFLPDTVKVLVLAENLDIEIIRNGEQA